MPVVLCLAFSTGGAMGGPCETETATGNETSVGADESANEGGVPILVVIGIFIALFANAASNLGVNFQKVRMDAWNTLVSCIVRTFHSLSSSRSCHKIPYFHLTPSLPHHHCYSVIVRTKSLKSIHRYSSLSSFSPLYLLVCPQHITSIPSCRRRRKVRVHGGRTSSNRFGPLAWFWSYWAP